MSDFVMPIVVSALGLLATAISRYGLQVARELVGSRRLAEFASHTVVLALRRGVVILKEEISVDGWQPEDAAKALRESGRVILGAALSQDAINMYLNELPDWVKRQAFGTDVDANITLDPRNLEAIEAQLAGAAEGLIDGGGKQLALADTWFRARDVEPTLTARIKTEAGRVSR